MLAGASSFLAAATRHSLALDVLVLLDELVPLVRARVRARVRVRACVCVRVCVPAWTQKTYNHAQLESPTHIPVRTYEHAHVHAHIHVPEARAPS